MNKYITAISSLIVFVIGYFYFHLDGLILEVSNGTKVYSNSLMSSGSDDGFIMSIGLMSFIFTIIASVFSFFKVISSKVLGWVYLFNLLFLAFITFLVNLDVSVYRSIKYGDYVLLSGFIVSIIPLILFTLFAKTKTNK